MWLRKEWAQNGAAGRFCGKPGFVQWVQRPIFDQQDHTPFSARYPKGFSMSYPSDLKYTKDHEWLRIEDDGTATIGITDFAQGELGDIVFVELEPEDTEVEKEGVFGTVEAVKTVSELFMPVEGTIVAINEALEDSPELVNEDPYGEGWMVKVSITDAEDLDELLSADDYAEMVG